MVGGRQWSVEAVGWVSAEAKGSSAAGRALKGGFVPCRVMSRGGGVALTPGADSRRAGAGAGGWCGGLARERVRAAAAAQTCALRALRTPGAPPRTPPSTTPPSCAREGRVPESGTRLRGSAEERDARLAPGLVRCPPVVELLEGGGLLLVRGAEQLLQLVDDRLVASLRRLVRLDEHPLARDVLRRGTSHLRLPLGGGATLRGDARGVRLQPRRPLALALGHRLGLVAGGREHSLRGGGLPGGGGGEGGVREVGELPPEESVVTLAPLHQQLERREQLLGGGLVPSSQAELGGVHGAQLRAQQLRVLVLHHRLQLRHRRLVESHPAVAIVALREQRQQRARERHHVDLRCDGLSLESELSLCVRGEGRPERLVLLHEAEGAVVHRSAREEHVVRVHVPLHVPHPQPARRQRRLPRREGAHHADDPLRQRRRAVHLGRKLPPHSGVEELQQHAVRLRRRRLGVVLSVPLGGAGGAAGVELEVAHAKEGGGGAAGDRAALGDQRVGRVVPAAAVALPVPHPAHALRRRGDQREGARRRDAKVVHRLGDEVLAHARAKHGATVAAAREGGRARTLELQLPPRPAAALDLAQRHRAAVAVPVAAPERVGRPDRAAEDGDGVGGGDRTEGRVA
mmetsp:Transcript_42613/g.141769  ORF Transcript_42613/g.141769 Transcript_42613/m.141769 type:complete len:629 (-) Transcript_42613:428-2314(-)